MRPLFLLACSTVLHAQLIPSGQPIPKGPNLPVVFLNGYQFGCAGGSASFSGTFGMADQILQSANIASVFFDNCTVTNSGSEPSIEALGIAFGQFLAGLQYADGSAVTQVNVIAHSMGGLIVRSYLAGKQDTAASSPSVFMPPASVPIRKAIFLATPNFGTAIANDLGTDTQTHEMQLGSQFLFDLATWNNNNDDLRGIDALAIIGNGGTGNESMPGFDDGVVTLTSASIGFALPNRTRIVPFCHTNNDLLIIADFCSSSTPAIADISGPDDVVGQMIVSFLTGTSLWQNSSLSQAIEDNAFGMADSAVVVEAQDMNGTKQTITNAATQNPGVTLQNNAVAYAEAVPANGQTIQVQVSGSMSPSQALHLRAGAGNALIVKPGPDVTGAVTAGSAIFPYNVAADGYVAIFGSNLTTLTQPQSAGVPYPTQLGDVQVTVNGATPAQIQYISPGQINIVYPNIAAGLTQLTIQSSGGMQTLNVLVAPAVPSVFTLDGTNNGPAAARIGNLTGDPVAGAGEPLNAGDFVELYMTGLGQTTIGPNGLNDANIQPTVTVGGQNCPVTYAGLVPGFAGFDQIDCQIPSGVSGATVPVIVTSNGRPSNAATLNVQ